MLFGSSLTRPLRTFPLNRELPHRSPTPDRDRIPGFDLRIFRCHVAGRIDISIHSLDATSAPTVDLFRRLSLPSRRHPEGRAPRDKLQRGELRFLFLTLGGLAAFTPAFAPASRARFLAATRTAFLAALIFLVHGRPRPAFGFLLRNVTLFVALFNVFRLSFLSVGIARLVSSRISFRPFSDFLPRHRCL